MKNSISGKRANAYGTQFETLIERSCRRYSRQGIAHIQKTPEPTKVIKPTGGGRYIMVFTKKAQPDFTGTLNNGQSIVLEAKHTNITNIEFKRISLNQENELNIHEELGAQCLVIIAFRMKDFYVIPWSIWKTLKTTVGKKSLNQKDLENYKIELKRGLLDFLNINRSGLSETK